MPKLYRACVLGACVLWGCSEPIVLGELLDAGVGGGGDAAPTSCLAPRLDVRVGDSPDCGDGPGFAFRSGLCICGNVVGNDRLEIDAMDSCQGSALQPGGSVGVNGFLSAGQLSVGGSLVVAGERGIEFNGPAGGPVPVALDLQSGGPLTGDGFVRVGGDADVAGDVDLEGFQVTGSLQQPEDKTLRTREGEPPTPIAGPVSVAEPCACDAGPDLAAEFERIRADNDNAAIDLDPAGLDSLAAPVDLRLPTGDYVLERLLAVQPVRVSVGGSVTLAIARDVLSEPGGTLEFTLAPEASLDLIVVGAVTLTDSLRLGDAASAGRARLYVGTDGTVNLAGRTTVAGPFYAPEAEVVTSDRLEVYGALLSRSFRYASPVTIHYDRALSNETCAPL